jgi:hypothetical protein
MARVHRLPLSRALPAAALLALVVPAVALGAAKAGSYSGTSSVKIPIVVGYEDTTRTDKGKVAFKVSGAKVTGFKVTGQQAFCGGQSPEIDVKIASIKLSAAGSGTGNATDPNVGPIKVTIKVTSGGKATGTIKYAGLCRSSAPFTAKVK